MATFSHDFADREATLDFQVGANSVQPLVTTAGYLPSGPLDALTLGNGAAEIRAFDSRYYPDHIRVQGTLDRLWTYQTDFVGNITEIAETVDCGAQDLTLSHQTLTTAATFQTCGDITAGPNFQINAPGDVTFQARGKVALQNGFSVGTGARFAAEAGAALGLPTLATRTYAYQEFQYFLTQGDGPWGTRAWTYDQIGNRLTETHDGLTDTYTYLSNLAAGNSPILDQVQQGIGGTRDFTFGVAGHQEEVANGANIIDFNSDAEGRLAELDRLGNTATFLYDGRSFLARAEEGGTGNFTEPTYASDGQLYSLSRSQDGGATTTREHVVYFAGRPVAIVSVPSAGAETTTFLSTDHLGTPFVAMDAIGEEIWAGGFEPFGRDWRAGLASGAQENGVFLRFPGQWFDGVWEGASLGAEGYYNVFRWYSPLSATYTRPDPVGLILANLSLFGYVLQNPSRSIDPVGLMTCVLISGDVQLELGKRSLVLGDHAALLVTGPCKATESCNPGQREFLFDPAGGYAAGFPDAGSVQLLTEAIPGWSFGGFLDYHCSTGSDLLEVYCFDTTCCEESRIETQVLDTGAVPPGLCSVAVGNALRGVGAFSGLGATTTPAILRRGINRILEKHTGSSGSKWTYECPP